MLPRRNSGSEEPQTIYANVGAGDQEEEKTCSYENVKDYVTSIDLEDDEGGAEEGGVYYNIPTDPSRNIEEEEEDEMYVYMKSGHNIDQSDKPAVPAPSATPPAHSSHNIRLQSEPLGRIKKYVNFSNEQKSRSQHPRSVGSRAAVAVGHKATSSSSSSSTEGARQGGGAGRKNGTETTEPESEEQPIYANYDQEEEELYTEVAGL